MSKTLHRFASCVLALPLGCALGQAASDPVWQPADGAIDGSGQVVLQPSAFASARLDRTAWNEQIEGIERESAVALEEPSREILLPTPSGGLEAFRIVESPVMADKLAARYPELRTFRGVGVDDPEAAVRLDVTPEGLHAQVLSPAGTWYVDPRRRGNDQAHISYYKKDYARSALLDAGVSDPDTFVCQTSGKGDWDTGAGTTIDGGAVTESVTNGATLRTYRLAVCAAGEYTAYFGGTVTGAMAGIVTAVNRVTGIYENDLAIRLILVANNDQLIFTDGTTDPFNLTDLGEANGQNQDTINDTIGGDSYDIGHLFYAGTNSGGLASLGVVCGGNKGRGSTGLPVPENDPFWVDYVSHEMGHQFGAPHTFNGVDGECAGSTYEASAAYEPGSGTTIMAYAGICDTDNVQENSNAYFHFDSLAQILDYLAGTDCAVETPTGNLPPTVDAGADYTIPMGTPFKLTAAGSDPDIQPVTYCWEEMDLGPQQSVTNTDNGSSPLFRSFPPTSDPWRVFPQWPEVLGTTNAIGEQLPTTARVMTFRCTVRDNRSGGGGIGCDDAQVTVDTGSGPFAVTSPNGGELAYTHLPLLVTWDVAGSSASPVNTSQVDIRLSTDGGQSFDVVLASSTPNDGSRSVTVPVVNTTNARILVESVGNIFFDVSDANFSLALPPLASMISPVGGSTFSDLSQTFTWSSPEGATSYRLQVGTSAGSADLHDEMLGSNVRTVSGLPSDGSLVYVRLWTESTVAGWLYQDYIYHSVDHDLVRWPSSFDHEVDEGLDASPLFFSVRNEGSGAMSYTVMEEDAWLSTDVAAGTSTGEWDFVTINFATAGLSPGTYHGKVEILSPTAARSPLLIPITLTVNPAGSSGMRFCVPQVITIPPTGTVGTASPYPSVMNVSGVAGTLIEASVELRDVHHTYPEDLDILLVGPNGNEAMLMSDAVGNFASPLTGEHLVFDSRAAMALPATGGAASGTYLPTDYNPGDVFPAPATPGPYSTDLDIFGVDPNGAWKLFVNDDYPEEDGGTIAGGWCLRVTTFFDACSTNGTLNYLPSFTEPSFAGRAEFYPQSALVQGVLGHVQKVTVNIDNLAHTRPDDLDILLVGPGGQAVLLMSDAGGGFSIPSPAGVDLLFGDSAALSLPDNAQITSGSYRPTDFSGGDVFPAPAPPGPYATELATFYGSDPNGVWNLYVVDDQTGEWGQMARWCVNLWVSGYLPAEVTLDVEAAGDDALVEVNTDGGGYFAIDGSSNFVDWTLLDLFEMTGEGAWGFIDEHRLTNSPPWYFYRSHWAPEPY